MRSPTSWTDLAGRRVAVWGLGTEGAASIRKLRTLGVEPVLVDDDPARVDEPTALPTGGAGLAAMLDTDAVVKTPGISRYRPEVDRLTAAGVPVLGGLGLWLAEADRDRVLCITGTKGKSTTTALAAHLARGLGRTVFAGGNLGAPPYDPEAPIDVDLWVIEVSSYQATDLTTTPPVVAVTALDPDHLPWHGDVETYYRDKLSMTTRPGARLTVASAASPALQERRGQLGPEVRWVDADTYPPAWREPLGLLGAHNAINANIARACLEEMGVAGADDDATMRRAAAGFTALDSRLELVASVDGVDFVDDSLSTNVLPTLAALDTFADRRVALIAGGLDRDIDYGPLAAGIVARRPGTLVVTVYSTGPRIGAALAAVTADADRVEVVAGADLPDAVRTAWRWARPDGVVLLSPAAASFDAFDDYRHRARVFRAAVDELRG
jgi:UDP-N-acetylmuramoylalanine--D-glutamate ligase